MAYRLMMDLWVYRDLGREVRSQLLGGDYDYGCALTSSLHLACAGSEGLRLRAAK